ncbi:MAG: RluA family pseudouridine synthase [Treponema sp.]|jgi:23S rRNA pseudouridine1911/1915/1917 synthase|nr:RluA family pseudouridine synthase [Treponema sp.]
MPSLSCTVEDSIPQGLRIDRYIAEYLKILSRSQIKARKLKASINGKDVKISHVLKGGEQLELSWNEADNPFLVPQNLPLDIIYEDERVIVINKTQGMVVHPGAGNRQGTLANALLYRMIGRNGNTSPNVDTTSEILHAGLRPGIVHRLDKDTSGVIIAAWDEEAQAFMSEQFKARKVRKSYAALVRGCPKDRIGCIDKRIVRSKRDRKIFTVSEKEGRPSLTYYKLIRSFGHYSLLLLRPKTGRTHQLRVHLKYLGVPILGDPLYGREDPVFKKATLMLHAKSLSLVLPERTRTEVESRGSSLPESQMQFRTSLPERFKEIISALRNKN